VRLRDIFCFLRLERLLLSSPLDSDKDDVESVSELLEEELELELELSDPEGEGYLCLALPLDFFFLLLDFPCLARLGSQIADRRFVLLTTC
jgi:hypothetical protein